MNVDIDALTAALSRRRRKPLVDDDISACDDVDDETKRRIGECATLAKQFTCTGISGEIDIKRLLDDLDTNAELMRAANASSCPTLKIAAVQIAVLIGRQIDAFGVAYDAAADRYDFLERVLGDRGFVAALALASLKEAGEFDMDALDERAALLSDVFFGLERQEYRVCQFVKALATTSSSTLSNVDNTTVKVSALYRAIECGLADVTLDTFAHFIH